VFDRRLLRAGALALSFGFVSGCSSDSTSGTPAPSASPWTLVGEGLDAALISVWGTSETDVWAAGSDAGDGPFVVHWDGTSFERRTTGTTGDLWWVFGFEGGPVFLGGANGTIVRYEGGEFTRMTTPSSDVTIFGLWGTAPDSMWAVGGTDGGASGAFAWRLTGDEWVPADHFPAELAKDKALWKVWGSADDDVWLVGTAGVAVHYDGSSFDAQNVGGGESLFTVHYGAGRFVAVGGGGTGLVFENRGSGWARVDDADLSGLVGVHVTDDHHAYAVGRFGAFVEEKNGHFVEAEDNVGMETLHSIWADPSGGLWTVGGLLDVSPPVRGVLAYRGAHPPHGVLQ